MLFIVGVKIFNFIRTITIITIIITITIKRKFKREYVLQSNN